MDKHFRKFLSAYLNVMDNPRDPAVTGKMGVWISGFFGSGKSHFLKVLSYLLGNRPHSYEGNTKRAVEFFDGKVEDYGWKWQELPPAQKLLPPQPLFSKLDDSLVEEETKKLGQVHS